MPLFNKGLDSIQLRLGNIPINKLYWGEYEIDLGISKVSMGVGYTAYRGIDVIAQYAVMDPGTYEYSGPDVSMHFPITMVAGEYEYSGEDVVITPPSTAVDVQLVHTFGAADGTNNATYTYLDVPFGAEAADREIWAVVGSGRSSVGSSTNSLTGCTIGGVTATRVAGDASGGTKQTHCDIFMALVPSGASGNIVTTGGGGSRRSLAAYRVTGRGETLDTHFLRDTVSVTAFNIDVPDDGFVIAGIFIDDTGVFGWTGATEDYDASPGSNARFTAAHYENITGSLESNHAISVTTSGSTEQRSTAAASIGV